MKKEKKKEKDLRREKTAEERSREIPRIYPTNQMEDGIIPRAELDEKGNYH